MVAGRLAVRGALLWGRLGLLGWGMKVLTAVLVCWLGGCSSLYYAGLEKVGVPKRELLTRRVEGARDAQEEVKEQFSSALERFRAVVNVQGGELETRYDSMRSELDKSEKRAARLDSKIDDVQDVAEALFEEWEDELDQYKSASLRSSSERRLNETKRSYAPMIRAMRRAEGSVEPVLNAFRDVVLALKHQLNARAIGSIKGELASVERELDALVKEMNQSIQEASKFLTTLERSPEG
ncbi:MAG: hypothetical protein RLZZ450_3706 [Pseudomonadota bacterium]